MNELTIYDVDLKEIPEFFNWKERQTKFIVNSVRVYEYFGFDWRIPLWDNELIEYWKMIEYENRFERKLFKSVLKEFLIVDLIKNVSFNDDLEKAKKKKISFKEIGIKFVPQFIKNWIKRKGFYKTNYINENEGQHLVYNHLSQNMSNYIKTGNIPKIIGNFLVKRYNAQEMKNLPINTVTTLNIIKKYHKQ